MNWNKVKIGDVYEGLFDGPHATPPVCESGAIYLGISNITQDGHIDYSNLKYISDFDLPKWTKRVTPKSGDIVFSYEATLNLYAIIPENFWGCLGRRMALIRPDETKAHGKFLYYYFFSEEWRATIAQHTITGATVDRIPIAKFPEFLISLPDLPTQHRIADLLSVYDCLIANNKKQIQLLEEATQRFYKEWFTGSSVSELRDLTLSEIVTFKRGKTITKAQTIEGNVPVVAGGLEPAYYHNEANTTAPVITVSGSGANAGFARMYFEDVFASDCSFADAESTPYLYFVYCFLKENKSQLDALQKGSAQPHVYAKDINAMVMKSIPEQKLEQFCGIVKPYFELMGNLEKQNKSAIEARDRLLPKLMNGEIEI